MTDRTEINRWLTISVIIVLQIADVLSTNNAISGNLGEINPIMALAQDQLGSAWWLTKLVIFVPVVICLSRLPIRFGVCVAALCFAVVCNNLLWIVL